MRKIYFIYLITFMLSLGGCITAPAFLSSVNQELTAKEQQLKCQEKCRDLGKVVVVTRHDYAELQQARKDNSFLYRKIEAFNRTIEKQNTVLSLQETVIRLFDDSNRSMQKNIEEQIAAQKKTSHPLIEPGKWVFSNTSLFEAGSTVLSSFGRTTMQKVAESLRQTGAHTIRVEGHADNRPLKKTAHYANNWELSTLRAVAVVQFLQGECGLEPERLSATGYSHYQPLVSNESAAGRQRNSRIEITVDGPGG